MTDFLYACLSGASAAFCFLAMLYGKQLYRKHKMIQIHKSKDANYWFDLYRVELKKREIGEKLHHDKYKHLYEQYMELVKAKQND